jgi:uncharacterized membrane protein
LSTIGTLLAWVALPVGVAAAAAALYGRYRTLPAFLTGPAICRLEANGCQVLFRTRLAALLGVPNSLLGVLLYGLIVIGLVVGWPRALLLAAATAALAMSVYLGYRLVRDRLECRICWTGHAANLLLWLGLVAQTVELAR